MSICNRSRGSVFDLRPDGTLIAVHMVLQIDAAGKRQEERHGQLCWRDWIGNIVETGDDNAWSPRDVGDLSG